MTTTEPPHLGAADLVRIAAQAAAAPACAACAPLAGPGWESLPASSAIDGMRRVGTLRQDGVEEPTYREYHPRGSHAWSADAPIAPAFFPYNRCDLWQCVACARPFLRYTEFGGYYEDERIRALRAELVDDTPAD